ncbi:chromate transporter [Halanaerobacter jeridensis]|uniref:Chromate transporter n=1 Tax=Halanaerobacter jeridensis TaxID=706427 RepID=A0A938XXH5_9FIRM|nr:chromate transporter [Halanaerobacter jeridensis]MBM7557447.1 chromate transporter [Halanaerobacter jeridensis]
MILLKLYITFFKIGLFTFGGGYAMLPLIQKEMIQHGWLTVEQFMDIVAVSQMTPGAIAINNATFIGFKLAGVPGVLATTLGVISPSLIIVLIIASVFNKFADNKLVQRAWAGIRPTVVGLILAAVISLGKKAITGFKEVLVAVIVLFLLVKLDLHPIIVIVFSAILGYLLVFV